MIALKTSELPSSLASELHVLYLAMWQPQTRERIVSALRETDFWFAENRAFFEQLCAVNAEMGDASPYVVTERLLKAAGENTKVCQGVLLNLMDIEIAWAPPAADVVNWHISQLIDMGLHRQLFDEAERLKAATTARPVPDYKGAELIAETEERLRDLRREMPEATEKDIQDLFHSYSEDYERAEAGEIPVARSVPIGIPSIDHANRGPFGSELVIICGRPSTGKTALALQAALAAAREDSPCYIISLEMDEVQIRDRAIANISGIPISDLRTKRFDDPQIKRYTMALMRFSGQCRVNFKSSMNVAEICSAIRQTHRVLGLKIAVIDQLSHIAMPGRGEDWQKIGEVTRSLKALARELKIPIVLLAQLSRESEKGNREPMLADLASSGRIEQDADQVWAIHAPKGVGDIERVLIVLKGRNTGAGHRVRLNFLTDMQRLEEAS